MPRMVVTMVIEDPKREGLNPDWTIDMKRTVVHSIIGRRGRLVRSEFWTILPEEKGEPPFLDLRKKIRNHIFGARVDLFKTIKYWND